MASVFGQIWSSVVLYSQSFNFSLSSIQYVRGKILQQFFFREENFLLEERKTLHTDSTSVIRKNDFHQTLGFSWLNFFDFSKVA